MKGVGQENNVLDFKLLQPGAPLSNRDDKRNLAVALSGYANADGGVVIWGVDARPDRNDANIDQVVETPGVENPRLLVSRLNELTAQACLPVPVGVEHRVIKAREGTSFVASLVPGSDSGPHLAKLGEDRYYTRSGGSFVRLEHFQVADMFGRRPSARLVVEALPDLKRIIVLRIDGRGSARAPYLLYEVSSPYQRYQYGVDGNNNENLPLRPHRGGG